MHYKIVVLGEGTDILSQAEWQDLHLSQISQQQVQRQDRSHHQRQLSREKGQIEQWANGQIGHLGMPSPIEDTAGQEEYNSLAPIYYKDAIGAIIVYDITSRESFDMMKKWVLELSENAAKDIMITIAGNKSDLENGWRVLKEEVEAFAKKHAANHFTVSAKNWSRIDELFHYLAERVHAANVQETVGKRGGPKLTVER